MNREVQEAGSFSFLCAIWQFQVLPPRSIWPAQLQSSKAEPFDVGYG